MTKCEFLSNKISLKLKGGNYGHQKFSIKSRIVDKDENNPR